MKILILVLVSITYVATETAPYKPRGFRPSQPFNLPNNVPAKQYGPPKPEYGPPDDKTEPTTQPTTFNKNTPTKIGSQFQSLPFKNHENFSFQQFNNNKINQQQSLPEFGNKLIQFKPQQNILQYQELPKPVASYIFDEDKIRNDKPFVGFPKNNVFEIQRSQQIHLSHQPAVNIRSDNDLIAFGRENRGKENVVQNFPHRQYLTPTATSKPTSTSKPSIRRRKPVTTTTTTTETSETEVIRPVTRRPNVSIANAFAGRLFLLQPDGRLEPVLLRRINGNNE